MLRARVRARRVRVRVRVKARDTWLGTEQRVELLSAKVSDR